MQFGFWKRSRRSAPLLSLVALAALLLCGTRAQAVPEISVTQRRTTLFSEGTPFDFGTTREDKALTQTFVITNIGDTDLTIDVAGIEVAEPFQMTLAPVEVVRPGRRTVMRLTIPVGAPTGGLAGEVRIPSDDADENPFVLRIEGTVTPVAPIATVKAGLLELLPGDLLDMGDITADSVLTRSITITNTGNATLNISNISVDNGDFGLTGRLVPLRPRKRLSFGLFFSSSQVGLSEGVLTIVSDDPQNPEFEIPIEATVLPSDAALRIFSQGQPIAPDATIEFARTRSDRAVDRVITIRNEGRSNLTISNTTVTGDGFSIVGAVRSPLARGKSTKFRVRLNPGSSVANPMGTLTFNTNVAGAEEVTLNLTGNVQAVAPVLSVSGPNGAVENGDEVNFGSAEPNQTITSTFTLRNSGTATLMLGAPVVSGAGFALVNPAPEMELAPNQSTTLRVRLFSAVAIPSTSGTVTFSTNVPGTTAFSIRLLGSVAVALPSPEIVVQDGTLTIANNGPARNFGSTPAGTTIGRTFTIDNVGTQPLTLSNLMLQNVSGSTFSILSGSPLPAMLMPADPPHQIVVQFTPSDASTFFASLSFVNNDPDDGEGPTFVIPLTGTGTPAVVDVRVLYNGLGGVRMIRNGAMPPFVYPYSLGSVPAGGELSSHVTSTDSLSITNVGQTPIVLLEPVLFDQPAANQVANGPPSTLWTGNLSPPLTFPATPTQPGASASINVTHRGLNTGQSIVRFDLRNDPLTQPIFPFILELQEWVYDWFATAGGLNGGAVRAMTAFDPDESLPAMPSRLYAAGEFTTPAGSPRIASLNGGTWTALTGGGVNDGRVNALAVFNESGGSQPARLFAAGSFASVGAPAITVNNIAKWNGTSWSHVGAVSANGVTGGVINALAVFDANGTAAPAAELYAAGSFTNAGSLVGVQGIARWDGTNWVKLRTTNDGVTGGVINALATFDPDGANGPQNASLFAGGTFSSVGGLIDAPRGLARWNGTTWSVLGSGTNTGVSGFNARVNAMVEFDPDGPDGPQQNVLVIGGSFAAAGLIASANNIAAWNGNAFVGFADGITPGAASEVFALAVFDEDAFDPTDIDGDRLSGRTQPGRLYAAGNFQHVLGGGEIVSHIARWNGTAWGPVGSALSQGATPFNGTNGQVLALGVFDADGPLTGSSPNNPARLFPGGLFTTVQRLGNVQLNPGVVNTTPVPVNNVACWGSAAP